MVKHGIFNITVIVTTQLVCPKPTFFKVMYVIILYYGFGDKNTEINQ